MYLSTENSGTNLASIYNSICSDLITVGWELFYTTSSTNKTYRSNGEDGLGPYVYLNLYISSDIKATYYMHWTTVGMFPVSSVGLPVADAVDTVYRFYGNKDFLVFGGAGIVSGVGVRCGLIYLRAPDRVVKTIANPVVGGTTVVLELPDLNQIFLGYKYNIFGTAGEGQQELTVININTGTNEITVNGCTNNYSAGALFGEHIVTIIGFNSGYGRYQDALNYNRVGTTLSGEISYYAGMLGGEGAAYAHNTDIILEPMVVYNANRCLGMIDPDICLYCTASGTQSGDMLFLNNDGSVMVPTFPSSVSSLSITDTTKNWPVNSLAGKICIFPTGTSMGYSRYIVSNTSNTLTFRIPLPTGITTTTGYGIVDRLWRTVSISMTSSGFFAVSEIF